MSERKEELDCVVSICRADFKMVEGVNLFRQIRE